MSIYKIAGNKLYIVLDEMMRIRIPKVLEDYQVFLQYAFQQYAKDGSVCFEFNPNIIQTRKHLQFTISPFIVRQLGLNAGDTLTCDLGTDFYGFQLTKVEKKE